MSPADAGLLERRHELAVLERLVLQAASGGSATVRILGAPGTGRTALLTEAAALAARARMTVRWTRCYASGPSAVDIPGIATEPGPLAVLIDDVQWADVPTRSRLAAIGRPGGILVVYTETTGLSTVSTVDHLDDDFGHVDRTLVLEPLSPAASAELLRRLGHQDKDAVTAGGGNPAVLTEAVQRRAFGEGALAELCDVVRIERGERLLDGLPSRLTDVLRGIAVGRGRFGATLLAELTHRTPGALAEDLRRLRGAGLAEVRAGGVRTPVAHRVLADMTGIDRAALFRRAAELGRRRGLEPLPLGEILMGASPVGEPWVPLVLRSAARDARATGRDELAVRLLNRMLREPLGPDERAETLLALGTAEAVVNQEASDRHLGQVLRGLGDGADGPRRVAAADLLLARGAHRSVRREIPPVFADPTMSTVDKTRLVGMFWLAECLACEETGYGRGGMPSLSERPVDPDPAAVAAARLALRGVRPARVRELARAAFARPVGPDTVFTVQLAAADALRLTGDMLESLRRIDELLAEARGRGAPVLVARALLARAQAGLAAGALDEAEDDLAQARRALPPESWHPGPRASLVAAEIAVQLERDRVDLAEEAVARAPEPIGSSLSSAHLRHATGRLLFAAGRADEALSRFRECGRQLSAHGWENPELLPWRSAAAACLAARGSDEAAARLMAEEIALAARWGTPAATGGAELRAARAALGRPAAVVHLERAVSLLCRGSAYLRQVTALLELATVRVQDGDSEAAGSLVAKAGLLIARHGWTHLVPRLRELAKELEGPAGAVPELSKSQRQVAELAALGVSNAGIAARLAVTKRTVELHLTQVYRKLGIGGRGQLSGSLYPRGTDAGGSAHSRTGTDAFGATAAEA